MNEVFEKLSPSQINDIEDFVIESFDIGSILTFEEAYDNFKSEGWNFNPEEAEVAAGYYCELMDDRLNPVYNENLIDDDF